MNYQINKTRISKQHRSRKGGSEKNTTHSALHHQLNGLCFASELRLFRLKCASDLGGTEVHGSFKNRSCKKNDVSDFDSIEIVDRSFENSFWKCGDPSHFHPIEVCTVFRVLKLCLICLETAGNIRAGEVHRPFEDSFWEGHILPDSHRIEMGALALISELRLI